MLYLVSFIVLADSFTYARYSAYFGMLAALIFGFEVLWNGQVLRSGRTLTEIIKPVSPYLAYVAVIFLSVLLLPIGLTRFITIVQLFVLLFIVYFLVRQSGETWFLQLAFLIGLLYVTAMGSWSIQGERFSFDPTGSGYDEDSMNPNRYAQYLNLFILLSIKYVLIDFRDRGFN